MLDHAAMGNWKADSQRTALQKISIDPPPAFDDRTPPERFNSFNITSLSVVAHGFEVVHRESTAQRTRAISEAVGVWRSLAPLFIPTTSGPRGRAS